MSVAATASRGVSWLRRDILATVFAVWRGITVEQWVAAALLAVASGVPDWVGLISGRGQPASDIFNVLIGKAITAFCLLLAVVLADHAVDRGAGRVPAYASALGFGIVAGTVVAWLVLHYLLNAFDPAGTNAIAIKGKVNPYIRVTLIANHLLEWMVLGGLATYVYADRRETQRMLAQLHAAQVDQATRARQVIESQLQAMQARVEPAFLFNTLAQVRRSYDIDAALADRMLDDLIVYLRAAMPRMRDTTSTLGQETELARAYLAIAGVRLGGRLSCVVDIDPDIGDPLVPPMMLLPLINHAIGHVGTDAEAARIVRISAALAEGRLRISVSDSHGGLAPETEAQDVAGIRDRLRALFGNDATLVLHRLDGSGTEAVLTVPHVDMPDDAERASANATTAS